MWFILIMIMMAATISMEFMYGIYKFKYNTKFNDIIRYKFVAIEVQKNYNVYTVTHNNNNKVKALKMISEIEKYVDIYDARMIYGVDLVNIKNELQNE